MKVRLCFLFWSRRARDSRVLTCDIASDAVQLWHRGNYHWYLKQTIAPRLSVTGDLTGFEWHPEKATELEFIATGKPSSLIPLGVTS